MATTGASVSPAVITAMEVVEQRYLPMLRHRNADVRVRGGRGLRQHVKAEARNMTSRDFSDLSKELSKRIFDLINRGVAIDRIAGILAMDELIDIPVKDNETKIIRFANFLRGVFVQPNADTMTLKLAAKTLGHLAMAGGPITADFVEFEVKRALEWLHGADRTESRRQAAVLVLRQLAESAPTLFFQHVASFFQFIQNALNDANPEVRESSAKALCATLELIGKRQARQVNEWYDLVYRPAMKGLSSRASNDMVHGSLLAISELMHQHNTTDYMLPKFIEVCDQVQPFWKSRDRIVRRTLIALQPRLATFQSETFASRYLTESLENLLLALGVANERATAFLALGRVACAVCVEPEGMRIFSHALPRIMEPVKDALSTRKKFCREALMCVAMLSQALGHRIKEDLHEVLGLMFTEGLSSTLTDSLVTVAQSIPPLLPLIQERLLHELSMTLAHTPFAVASMPGGGVVAGQLAGNTSAGMGGAGGAGGPGGGGGGAGAAAGATPTSAGPTSFWGRTTKTPAPVVDEAKSEEAMRLTQLALRTLASFDFQGVDLLPFVRHTVVAFLDDESATIRREAALTCSSLLLDPATGGPNSWVGSGPTAVMVAEVLERLLAAAVGDPEASIRETVLQSLDPRFDPLLAQAQNLRTLRIGLHDEVYSSREATVRVIGRLAHRNPACIMPVLRKALMQLLMELEFSNDARNKEEAAQLLGHLIRAARGLFAPYVGPILEALLPKLETNGAVSSSVLATLGELSEVGSKAMRPFLPKLLPLIIDTLQHNPPPDKQEVAVRTLGLLLKNTGYVIEPYLEHPELLGILLGILNAGTGAPWKLRQEVLRTMGILGAVDPYRHKMVQQQSLTGRSSASAGRSAPAADTTTAGAAVGEQLAAGAVAPAAGPTNMLPSSMDNQEEYYPTVAITALMRILADLSLSTHHTMVVQAIMFIFRPMGLKCVPFLAQIVPSFLGVMKRPDQALRDSLLRELDKLVELVKHHIRPYLAGIIGQIQQFWPSSLEPTLRLITTIATALRDEFKVHLAELMPLLLRVLMADRESIDIEDIHHVLTTVVALGQLLEDYMYIIVPCLVRLVEQPDLTSGVQQASLEALGRLCRVVHLAEYSSRIVQPIVRLLDRPDASPELKHTAMDTLCALVRQMRGDFLVFERVIRKPLAKYKLYHEQYERLVNLITSDSHLPPDPADESSSFGHGGVGSEGLESGSALNTSDMARAPERLAINQEQLKRAWETAQLSTKEDWSEWMRRFSLELLRESPYPALRACSALAQVYRPLARELFNPAFLCCWHELHEKFQDELVEALEIAFQSPTIPPEIMQTLLNLAEFLEHDEKALPIDIRTLGRLAEKCHAYAKALHYKEMEFQSSPATAVESLISINNQLGQPEAAVGVLKYVSQQSNRGEGGDDNVIEAQESWYEKLGRWEEALQRYERKQQAEPTNLKFTFARMRCLNSLGEWERLSHLASSVWPRLVDEPSARKQVAPMAARAAWGMSQWSAMEQYVGDTAEDLQGYLFRAVLSIHKREFEAAQLNIDNARQVLATELTALVGESYNRAYRKIVTVQQLTELEEIVTYLKLHEGGVPEAAVEYKTHMREIWERRLRGCQRNVDIWQRVLSVRSLVVIVSDDMGAWIKFAALCRKSGRMAMALRAIMALGIDGRGGIRNVLEAHHQGEFGMPTTPAVRRAAPRVVYAYLKYLWAGGDKGTALQMLRSLTSALEDGARSFAGGAVTGFEHSDDDDSQVEHKSDSFNPQVIQVLPTVDATTVSDVLLRVRCHRKLGEWRLAMADGRLSEDVIHSVLSSFHTAVSLSHTHYKAWHSWALMNFQVAEHYLQEGRPAASLADYLAAAVQSFFHSIALGQSRGAGQVVQDLLRLLTIWFTYGSVPVVHGALDSGLTTISIDTWLQVIPQLIARIHVPTVEIRNSLHRLLTRVGQEHPQALVYPLTVASKSTFIRRQTAANGLLDDIRRHRPKLVEQAELVSRELIRIAILWNEQWHKGLEEASRLYFGDHDTEGMLAVLLPLHKMMDAGATTSRETSFQQMFGRDLSDAYDWLMQYQATRQQQHVEQAWECYYRVFRQIDKQLPLLKSLELQYVSPSLLHARDMELAVPGTYVAGEEEVRIKSFAPLLTVISSKQRPRKITMEGSDGQSYVFLLKGHEDLRQDERVMQLFGLVNALLTTDPETAKRDLSIQRYSVTPLSHNAGVVGWVPHCDTLHVLIKQYREARKILLNIEQKLIVQMAPMYEHLTLIQKVEVFEYALENTSGQDLYKVLWLQSQSAEVWLDRRTSFTRSLAVMSMVGYILGLGDRHTANLMLDRYTGKVVHIDFGDCFEVAVMREKFPEKIPFRLTRMLVQAMEVCGIEGNFRSTAEAVMRVIRENRDSVMAMLEAFVHDPLIQFRLLNERAPSHAEDNDAGATGAADAEADVAESKMGAAGGAAGAAALGRSRETALAGRQRADTRGRSKTADFNNDGADVPAEALSERALKVIQRIREKLAGRDFDDVVPLDVPAQVERLIEQAMSHENLCQCYIGWYGRHGKTCCNGSLTHTCKIGGGGGGVCRCPFW